MNETIKTLCSRASCRSFRGEQISISELREVLAAGSHAPSGMNRHSARAVAVQNPDKIKLLSQLNASVMGGSGDPLLRRADGDRRHGGFLRADIHRGREPCNREYAERGVFARSRLMLDPPCKGRKMASPRASGS